MGSTVVSQQKSPGFNPQVRQSRSVQLGLHVRPPIFNCPVGVQLCVLVYVPSNGLVLCRGCFIVLCDNWKVWTWPWLTKWFWKLTSGLQVVQRTTALTIVSPGSCSYCQQPEFDRAQFCTTNAFSGWLSELGHYTFLWAHWLLSLKRGIGKLHMYQRRKVLVSPS